MDLHYPTNGISAMAFVAEDLINWTKPSTIQLYHYMDNVMLTSDSLSDLHQAAPMLEMYLQGKGWAINESKLQSPGVSIKFLEAVWSDKTKVMPATVTDKIQASSLPTTVKTIEVLRSLGILEGFHPTRSTAGTPPLIT